MLCVEFNCKIANKPILILSYLNEQDIYFMFIVRIIPYNSSHT